MIGWLKGKKSYIIAILFGITGILHAAGILDLETLAKIDAILAAFGFGFLRAGISKVNER